MSEMRQMIKKPVDDGYECVDSETGEFLGMLYHTVGPWGESTGIFRQMETTSLFELGYEE